MMMVISMMLTADAMTHEDIQRTCRDFNGTVEFPRLG
jgi:hypothetical protein